MSAKKAILWFVFWVCLAALFDTGIYFFLGKEESLEFLGGYVIEKSLSLDNLFLFLVVFSSFEIKPSHQRRILNYGIIGAVILRFLFVMFGIVVVNSFHWILYVFGGILIFNGIKMLFAKAEKKDLSDSKTIRMLGRIIPVSSELDGDKFFTVKNGVKCATLLMAVLVLIEGSDIIFAIDSIPAVFSITTDPFIVYTSNLFAIMGLRSMYFLIEKLNSAFEYVKYGVSAILSFTGVKLSILFFSINISVITSIFVIGGILAASILASIVAEKLRMAKAAKEKAAELI